MYLLNKKKKKELFKPIKNIIHPAKTKLIHKELKNSLLISKTQDEKYIYLLDYILNSSVMRETGRLRELSFRQVQEGTGNVLDVVTSLSAGNNGNNRTRYPTSAQETSYWQQPNSL